MDGKDVHDVSEIPEDFALLAEGMKLLQYDYLGAHGSRGYGRVSFSQLEVTPVVGALDKSILEACRNELAGV